MKKCYAKFIDDYIAVCRPDDCDYAEWELMSFSREGDNDWICKYEIDGFCSNDDVNWLVLRDEYKAVCLNRWLNWLSWFGRQMTNHLSLKEDE